MQSIQVILLFLLAAQSVLAWSSIDSLRTEFEPVSTVSIPAGSTVERHGSNPYNYLLKRFVVSEPAHHKILRIEEPWTSVLPEEEIPVRSTNEVLVHIVKMPRVVADEYSAPVAYSSYSHPNIHSRVLYHNQVAARYLPTAHVRIVGYPNYPRLVRPFSTPYSFDHYPLADNLISGPDDDFLYSDPNSVENYPTPVVDYPIHRDSYFQPQAVEQFQTYPEIE